MAEVAPRLLEALGAAIGPNVILYGELWGMTAVNPSVPVPLPSSFYASQGSLNCEGLGVGLGGFFTSFDLFLGISLDATHLGLANASQVVGCGGDPSCSGGPGSGNPFSTSIGGGATLSLGRQWSLSRGLGLGFELKAVGSLNSVSYQGVGNAYLTLLGAALLALTFG